MMWRTTRFLGTQGLLALTVLTLLTAGSCGDDDENGGASEEELRQVEETTKQVFGSDGSNANYFFAHVTDNVIATVLFSERSECEAAAAECIGEPTGIESFSGTRISGDTAMTIAVADFLGPSTVGLVREDGVWKVDSVGAASDELPDDATLVDLGLSEFNFIFDASDIPAGGNFAFAVTNHGVQAHEVVVLSVPEDGGLEDAIGAVESEEIPPVALKVYIQPGQEIDMAFDEPLPAGDYALVCFFPDTDDPEFAAHIEKGMVAEFTVR